VVVAKPRCLTTELSERGKGLGAEEGLVKGILEALDLSISPGFSLGNKHCLDSQRETEPEHHPQGVGIAIRSPEGQFIIHLEKIGYAQLLPGIDQCLCDAPIVFATRGINRNPMGSDIHYVEAVEPAISSDVPRPHDICLVDIVDADGLWFGVGRPSPSVHTAAFFVAGPLGS